MLDLNELLKQQREGVRLLSTLNQQELLIIQSFTLMTVKTLVPGWNQQNQSTRNMILNAFQNGICLGLGIDVSQGQVIERGK